MQFKFLMAVAAVVGSALTAGAALAAAHRASTRPKLRWRIRPPRPGAVRRGWGWTRVLIRLSGTAPLPTDPVLQEALSQPERYYDRYLVLADDRLKLFFTPSAMLELIDQAKLPLWPLRRPPAIAWLALEQGGGREIVRGGHPLAVALVAEARRRGFEVRLPLMDLRDQLGVQPAAVWGRSSLVLAEASRRYGAAAVLIGRLWWGAEEAWSGDFAHWQAGDEFTFQINNLDFEQAGAAGANFLANAMASRAAIPWQPVEQRSLVVSGIASPLHYGSLLRYLAGLEYLAGVAVDGLNQDRLDIQVRSRAETGRLVALLQADGRMTGPVPGAPANQLTWRGVDDPLSQPPGTPVRRAVQLSHLPNAITLLRILLVVPITWLLWQMRYPEALVLMAIAGASDAVDGLLARRFGWGTEFGALVDPFADKVMVVAVFRGADRPRPDPVVAGRRGGGPRCGHFGRCRRLSAVVPRNLDVAHPDQQGQYGGADHRPAAWCCLDYAAFGVQPANWPWRWRILGVSTWWRP